MLLLRISDWAVPTQALFSIGPAPAGPHVEGDRGGGGCIQRLDAGLHRDPPPFTLAQLDGEPRALGADDQPEGIGKRGLAPVPDRSCRGRSKGGP